MAYTLLGKNFIPDDVQPKVTGKANYAEDFRAEGMVFCRLLLSTVPHGRVTNIEAGSHESVAPYLNVWLSTGPKPSQLQLRQPLIV